MIKQIFILLLAFSLFLLLNSSIVWAKGVGLECSQPTDCDYPLVCKRDSVTGKDLCQTPEAADVFGKITPPDAIKNLMGTPQTASFGISQFLTNLVALIYSLAVIVLIFMLLWGAFDWMISEGDKEKLQNAQRKIINAIIGIILFAVVFAIIQILGTFTGFHFFAGQK